MAKLLGVHPDTLKKYRVEMMGGIHYIRPNSRVIRYNRDLVIHWFQHRHELEVHQRLINVFVISQPENQPLKRGRKACTKSVVSA